MTAARAKRIRAKVGDIFTIPISGAAPVFGQVIEQPLSVCLVVLFHLSSGSIDDILESAIDLAGYVFDAKFRNGDWPIVATRPPVRFEAPWFVMGHPGLGNLRLTNLDGSITRPATQAEAARHGHLQFSYPMVLQMAALAWRDQGEWLEAFNSFRQPAGELRGGR